MDDIFANKPVDQLENADSEVKKYVLQLEKKLKNCIAMNNLNKDMQKKLLNTQEELKSLKLQTKGNEQNDGAINQLKVENTLFEIENKQLKQTILILQNEVQQLKVYAEIIKTPAAAAIPAAYTNHTTQKQQPCNNNIPDNDPNANSVLVKGFAEMQLNRTPKINIINLGRLMNLKLIDKDVVKVTIMERKYYERHNLKPNKVILIVQFRTPEIKVDFLKNKEKLKSHTNLEGIEIIDYVSDEVYNLYQYAKILKTFGYAQIYWRNNCVYAKRTRSTLCDPILIKTKNDVDALKVSKK